MTMIYRNMRSEIIPYLISRGGGDLIAPIGATESVTVTIFWLEIKRLVRFAKNGEVSK